MLHRLDEFRQIPTLKTSSLSEFLVSFYIHTVIQIYFSIFVMAHEHGGITVQIEWKFKKVSFSKTAEMSFKDKIKALEIHKKQQGSRLILLPKC